MAFVKINKSRIGTASGTEPVVTMGAYLADGKIHKSRSIAFRMTKALINQLGWELPDGKIGIAVHEGIDKDTGFIQLIPDKDGYRGSQGQDKGQGVSISVTSDKFKHYVLNECPVPSQTVNHIIDGNALIVEVPDWLRFNPQSVPQPEKPAWKKPVLEELHLNRAQRRRLEKALNTQASV